jgi:hypothetical protein
MSTSKDPSVKSVCKQKEKSLADVVDRLFEERSNSKKQAKIRMSIDKVKKNSNSIQDIRLLVPQTGKKIPKGCLNQLHQGLDVSKQLLKSFEKEQRKVSRAKHVKSLAITSPQIEDSSTQNHISNTQTMLKKCIPPRSTLDQSKKPDQSNFANLFHNRNPARLTSLKSEHSKGSGIKSHGPNVEMRAALKQNYPPIDLLEKFYLRLCELVENGKTSDTKRLKAISKMFVDYAKLVESYPKSVVFNFEINSKIIGFFAHFTSVKTKAYLAAKKWIQDQKKLDSEKARNTETRFPRNSVDDLRRHSRSKSLDKSTRNLRAHEEKSSDDSNIEKELDLNQEDSISQTTPLKPLGSRVHQSADPKEYRTNDAGLQNPKIPALPGNISQVDWLAPSALHLKPHYQQAESGISNNLPSQLEQVKSSQPPNRRGQKVPLLEYETTLSRLKISQIKTEKSIVFEEEKVKLFRPTN